MAEKFYYIVNPKGAIHIVSEDHAKARLKIIGWRLATSEERASYEKANGNQRFNKPLATPFTPMPVEEAALSGAEFVPESKDEPASEPIVKKSKKNAPESAG